MQMQYAVCSMQCMMQMQVDWLLAAVDCSLQSATTPAPQPPAQLVALVACFYLLSFFVGLVACILLVVLLFDLLFVAKKRQDASNQTKTKTKTKKTHDPISQQARGQGAGAGSFSPFHGPFGNTPPSLHAPRPSSSCSSSFYFLPVAGPCPLPLPLHRGGGNKTRNQERARSQSKLTKLLGLVGLRTWNRDDSSKLAHEPPQHPALCLCFAVAVAGRRGATRSAVGCSSLLYVDV